ncbi:MAG: septum formation protein Maf [Bacteroidales bacterium]|nr:septum formation protein Maf [Bacteroidales bacterium]
MLNDILKGKRLILASKSPRRQQLLRELGVDFEVRANGDDEELYPSELSMTEIPVYLAKQKAKPLLEKLNENDILITSDTIVWCKGQVIGKPNDEHDAFKILSLLSGNKHIVITGVCISSVKKSKYFHTITDVYFRKLTNEEIWYYINNFKPFDKAGAYGIQEWIGFVGVERIDGSYFNVMGLPIQQLYTELQNFINKSNIN